MIILISLSILLLSLGMSLILSRTLVYLVQRRLIMESISKFVLTSQTKKKKKSKSSIIDKILNLGDR